MTDSNTDLPPGTYRHPVLVLRGELHDRWNYLGRNEPWLAVKELEDFILSSEYLEVAWDTALMVLLAQVCQDGLNAV
jgi:hypothetical protein